jgi:diguanylate cyclase (GGDEF)-like protein
LIHHNPILAGPLILLVPIIVFSLIGLLWGGLLYLVFACYTLFLVRYNGHVDTALNPNALFNNYLYSLILGGGASYFLEVGKFEVIDKLHNLATRDKLTQCWNRDIFIKSLDSEILKAYRLNTTFTLVMFDLDYFKRINDVYGHNTGDIVLKEFVNVVNQNIRDEDIFARWGGEEFTLIFSGANQTSALEKVEHILLELRNYQFTDVENVTCSAGLISYIEGISAKEMLHKSDIALYKAKKLGRDQVVVG